jgi:hypothetical protein
VRYHRFDLRTQKGFLSTAALCLLLLIIAAGIQTAAAQGGPTPTPTSLWPTGNATTTPFPTVEFPTPTQTPVGGGTSNNACPAGLIGAPDLLDPEWVAQCRHCIGPGLTDNPIWEATQFSSAPGAFPTINRPVIGTPIAPGLGSRYEWVYLRSQPLERPPDTPFAEYTFNFQPLQGTVVGARFIPDRGDPRCELFVINSQTAGLDSYSLFNQIRHISHTDPISYTYIGPPGVCTGQDCGLYSVLSPVPPGNPFTISFRHGGRMCEPGTLGRIHNLSVLVDKGETTPTPPPPIGTPNTTPTTNPYTAVVDFDSNGNANYITGPFAQPLAGVRYDVWSVCEAFTNVNTGSLASYGTIFQWIMGHPENGRYCAAADEFCSSDETNLFPTGDGLQQVAPGQQVALSWFVAPGCGGEVRIRELIFDLSGLPSPTPDGSSEWYIDYVTPALYAPFTGTKSEAIVTYNFGSASAFDIGDDPVIGLVYGDITMDGPYDISACDDANDGIACVPSVARPWGAAPDSCWARDSSIFSGAYGVPIDDTAGEICGSLGYSAVAGSSTAVVPGGDFQLAWAFGPHGGAGDIELHDVGLIRWGSPPVPVPTGTPSPTISPTPTSGFWIDWDFADGGYSYTRTTGGWHNFGETVAKNHTFVIYGFVYENVTFSTQWHETGHCQTGSYTGIDCVSGADMPGPIPISAWYGSNRCVAGHTAGNPDGVPEQDGASVCAAVGEGFAFNRSWIWPTVPIQFAWRFGSDTYPASISVGRVGVIRWGAPPSTTPTGTPTVTPTRTPTQYLTQAPTATRTQYPTPAAPIFDCSVPQYQENLCGFDADGNIVDILLPGGEPNPDVVDVNVCPAVYITDVEDLLDFEEGECFTILPGVDEEIAGFTIYWDEIQLCPTIVPTPRIHVVGLSITVDWVIYLALALFLIKRVYQI